LFIESRCSILPAGCDATKPRREAQSTRRSHQAVNSRRRWLIFAIIAVGFFIVALNGDIYNLTSPPTWSWHVVLRKSYSIVAFALVGGSLVWASGASLRTAAVFVAVYSGAIEVAQHILFGVEPFYWNVIDVICGAIGGALGALIPWVRAK
jgi:hypothetical protein